MSEDKIIPHYKLYGYKIERNDMNKYQEALNFVNSILAIQFGKKFSQVKTLQELIDNYNKMKNEFDMLLDTNKQFEKENIKLEKALDNACQKLNDCFYCHTLWECENTDEKQKYSSCNECIKEHILKESEKK